MNWLHGALAAMAGLLGVFVARHHPLSPDLLSLAFVAWTIAVCMRPALWLFLLPALLPVASFSPWTGWIGIEEFDLLALGAVAGCHARMTPGAPPGVPPRMHGRPSGVAEHGCFRIAGIALGALALCSALAMLRGLSDAGSFQLGWLQGYEEPLNSLRAGKAFAWVMLLLPSLQRQQQSAPALVTARLAAGAATGLAVVSLATLWERAAYPGLFDFSTPYRSTALFWEMNVGGAAIDGFLVLTVSFAVFAVLRAADVWRWCLAAALAVISAYACLTSFSRAVYLAAGVSLVVLAVMLPARRRLFASPATGRLPGEPPPQAPWRRWGGRLLVVVLIVEVLLVFVLGDFMGRRVSASERDLVGRLEHWSEGLALLRGPSDVLFGRGLGRFPANYSQAVPAHALPGRLRIIDELTAGRYLRLSGPPRGIARQGAFDLLQRVPPLLEGSYAVAMDLRAPQPVRLEIGVCQRHLLYDATCRQAAVMVPGGKPQWRRFSLLLPAAGVDAGQERPPALAFLSLRLAGPGDFVDIDNLRVVDAAGRDLLVNGDFSDGLTRWFFAGRHYFVPWHIDNLFLETLIDQGVIGLLLLLTLLAMAFANLLRGPGRGHMLAPYLLAALTASIVLGMFSSLLDVPRPAFLFWLLLCFALFLNGPVAAVPGATSSFRLQKGAQGDAGGRVAP